MSKTRSPLEAWASAKEEPLKANEAHCVAELFRVHGLPPAKIPWAQAVTLLQQHGPSLVKPYADLYTYMVPVVGEMTSKDTTEFHRYLLMREVVHVVVKDAQAKALWLVIDVDHTTPAVLKPWQGCVGIWRTLVDEHGDARMFLALRLKTCIHKSWTS